MPRKVDFPSRYRRGGLEKSCPRCSQLAGTYVYLELSRFGDRMLPSGAVVIQSYCLRCRKAAAKKQGG